MNCKLKDCPHNKGQDVSGTCHEACFYKFGEEMRTKGDEVKTISENFSKSKNFMVVNEDGQLSVDRITKAIKDDHLFGIDVSVRELPEPSQDVEAGLAWLWIEYMNLPHTGAIAEEDFKTALRQFVADNKRPEPIKLKSVETGVLMSPAEILGIPTATWMGWSSKNGKPSGEISTYQTEDKNRVVVDISKYPREFYKEIKTEVDYSSIQKGTLLKVTSKSAGQYRHCFFEELKEDYMIIKVWSRGSSESLHKLNEYTIEIISLSEVKCSGE